VLQKDLLGGIPAQQCLFLMHCTCGKVAGVFTVDWIFEDTEISLWHMYFHYFHICVHI